jgi:hypothetical protein
MTNWTTDELRKINAADELQIASVRDDGTLRDAVTIWVVRHGDDFYIRSVNGPTSSWFRGTEDRHEGHVAAGGVEKDVPLAPPDGDIEDEIDAAYRAKYSRAAENTIRRITSPEARATTLKLTPR